MKNKPITPSDAGRWLHKSWPPMPKPTPKRPTPPPLKMNSDTNAAITEVYFYIEYSRIGTDEWHRYGTTSYTAAEIAAEDAAFCNNVYGRHDKKYRVVKATVTTEVMPNTARSCAQ